MNGKRTLGYGFTKILESLGVVIADIKITSSSSA